jgi:hypothetical protein
MYSSAATPRPGHGADRAEHALVARIQEWLRRCAAHQQAQLLEGCGREQPVQFGRILNAGGIRLARHGGEEGAGGAVAVDARKAAVRMDRPVDDHLALVDHLAVVHQHVLVLRNQVLVPLVVEVSDILASLA